MESIRRILLPTDLSEASRVAFPYASAMAAAAKAELILTHIVNQGDLVGASGQQLRQMASTLPGGKAHLGFGRPVDGLIRVAAEEDASIAVMATHGRSGLSRAVMGSVAEGFMRAGCCPVVTVRSPSRLPAWPPRCILVPTDATDLSLFPLKLLSIFAPEGCEIILASMVSYPAYAELPGHLPGSLAMPLADVVAIREEDLTLALATLVPVVARGRYQVVVRADDPIRGILRAAEEYRADLIVMASHGFNGVLRLLLGSVTEGVMRRAACPVMVYREALLPESTVTT